jgi:autotransporter-associated beta strand protein
MLRAPRTPAGAGAFLQTMTESRRASVYRFETIYALVLLLLLNANIPAGAVTTNDISTMFGAFNSAFYVTSGSNGWFANDQTSGSNPNNATYFWGQAEEIECVIDAYEWTSNSTYHGMITNLLNGFIHNNGSIWTGDGYNDDIMWAVIAFARGGQDTGNTNYYTLAKTNFDAVYARAWDTNLGGGLYWEYPENASKNACVNGPGAIAASLLYQIYGDTNYWNKATNIYYWERSVLFNSSSGAIYDNIGTNGVVNTWSSTYNQGTFLGAANFIGQTSDATLAANYTMNSMTSFGILPEYGIANNNSGFNAIFLRWMTRFMNNRGLQSTYESWLQGNATAAWVARRTADNLSWCQWLQPSPVGTNFYSWDCISSVEILQAVVPTPDIYWQGGTADYNVGANWVGGGVPATNTNALNDSGSNNTVQINAGDPVWTLNELCAGDGSNANGAYVQSGSTVNVGNFGGWFRLGDSPGAAGYYTLNAGTLNVTNYFDVGETGTGVLNVNGGIVNIGAAGLFDISDAGTKGVVTQTSGTVNCSPQMWVGNNSGNGYYYLDGGTITVANYVAIGRAGGTGTLIVTNGTFNQTVTGNFVVGTDSGGGVAGIGTVEQSGGTIHVSQQLLIPEENTASVGTYNLSGTGHLIVDDWLAIGRGGTGYFNMSGGSITKTSVNGGNLDIGAGGAQNGGAGTLTQTGGYITNTAEQTWLGEYGNATWNLNGGTNILGHIYMCINNLGLTATLNLNGGLFQTSGITNNTPAGDTSTLNFNGGTLQANASSAYFIAGLSQALVGAGGAVIDSQGFSITIPQALVADGSGGLTKLGVGTLTLTATNTYTGATVISNGTLALSSSGQLSKTPLITIMPGMILNANGRSDETLTLNGGQTLTESGTVDGKLNALAGSTINPGASIGTLTVQNNITLAGQLTMNLNRTNVQKCNELVSSAGSITGGGVLTVNNPGPPLQLGDTFHLFNKPVSGFTTINLPNVAPYGWSNGLASSGTITVVVSSTIPTNITAQLTNNELTLSWPADHTGWTLQMDTNRLTSGSGTNWINVPNSTNVNQVTVSINPTGGSVFFRLAYPQ